MSKKYTTMLIVVVSIIAVIGITVGVSFAIWVNSDNDMDPAPTTSIVPVNTTAKYLVFEISDGTNFMYARYYVDIAKDGQQSGTFKYSSEDQNRYNDGVNPQATPPTTLVAEQNWTATVIGYSDYYYAKDLSKNPADEKYQKVGFAVGEVESLEIPESIPVEGKELSINVTKINLQSPEEFKPLLNIKSVIISKNITDILGVSFTGCINLEHIEYAQGAQITSLNIGANCFKGCAKERSFYMPKSA